MKLTEQQEQIYLTHITLLEDNHLYSEYAIRELENSYALYKSIQLLKIQKHVCTETELWIELTTIPVEDATVDMIEQIEYNIRDRNFIRKDLNEIMQYIIRLQIASGVSVKPQYYFIFLDWFDQLYVQVISKQYRDCYQMNLEKVKKIEQDF